MAEQKPPPVLTSDGMIFAAVDGVIALSMILAKQSPELKNAICGALSDRFAAHQKIADEHGTPANVNAAAAIRVIMMQVGCPNIPDHQ